MTRRYATAFPVLMGILAVLCVRRAFADGPPCASMTIEADAAVSTRWPGLIDGVREAFETRDDIDRCARVALTTHGATVTLAAVLPDGRSAARSVSRREDVVPTLEGLLLLPQRATPVAPQPSVAPSNPRLTVPDRDASPGSPGPSPSGLRIELSVMTGARMGDGRVGVGLGAFSLLDLSGWLVGFEARADRYRTLAPGWTGPAAPELAVLGGRRFRFRTIALDLVAGPALVLQGTTTFTTATPNGNVVTGSSASTAPRLLLSARVNFGALSVLRTFVGVDGELGPARLGDGADVPNLPRLPIWTLGLAFGGTVGTL